MKTFPLSFLSFFYSIPVSA